MFDITTNSILKTQKDMILSQIVRPFFEAFSGMSEYFAAKLLINVIAVATTLGLGLFATPELWWKGLVWLVFLDWVSGVITSIRLGTFSVRIIPQKWYQATGYVVVCGAAAVVSNSLSPHLASGFWADFFFGIQFVVYASFYIKEFISILKKWHLIKFFKGVWTVVNTRDLTIDDIIDMVRDKKEDEP